MTFVNDIADIVHATVETMMGSPNKNIGEAFLLVWKFPDESIHRQYEDDHEEDLKLEKSEKTM
jgi:hypothetical protein